MQNKILVKVKSCSVKAAAFLFVLIETLNFMLNVLKKYQKGGKIYIVHRYDKYNN